MNHTRFPTRLSASDNKVTTGDRVENVFYELFYNVS